MKMKCDNSECKNPADIIFLDGSKPTSLYLCNEHGYTQYKYYADNGLLFDIISLRSRKTKKE